MEDRNWTRENSELFRATGGFFRVMVVFSKYGGEAAAVTSQIVDFGTITDAEVFCRRLEEGQNGYTPWSALRLYDAARVSWSEVPGRKNAVGKPLRLYKWMSIEETYK